jgi:dienelactone hydrolase
MTRWSFLAVCTATFLLGAATAWGAVTGREVDYRSGDLPLKGYLVLPEGVKEKRPGVLVVHEWWGLNDFARQRAKKLAEAGYVALAVDMFGEGKVAGHPDEAGRFANALMKNKKEAEKRFDDALEFLKRQPSVDSSRIAAIGYCFGGGVVLHMARQGADLKGVVSYHGTLATDAPAKPGAVKARVLAFTGEADKMVPPEQVAAFRQEMEKAGASYRVVEYPGAKHSFTNPDADRLAKKFNLPLGYDRKAAKDSWQQTLKFLKEVLR